MFVGRQKELDRLSSLLRLSSSSFVAVYGRRRIGKTEMVRYFSATNNLFALEFTGKKDAAKRNQIASFLRIIEEKFNVQKQKATDWAEAFEILKTHLQAIEDRSKKVIFVDELPWLDSAKSGFLDELAYFWNNHLSVRQDIILIVCGSAASYMIKKVIHNIGPLHGRLTEIIPLKQFDLFETKELLMALGCRYSDTATAAIYMAFGGVAKYLSAISPSKTPIQNIQELCFGESGFLKNEYKDLFTSLFSHAKTHYAIMNHLSSKWSGMTQKELATKVGISEGSIKEPIEELLASGFISKTPKFGQTKRDIIYRATDCFSYFHHKWMKEAKVDDFGAIATSQSYKSWSGFAFENLCHMHIEAIKGVLGISGVPTQTHYWSYAGDGGKGAQIDMLIEHTNGSKNIDIIECKYYDGVFGITKEYKEALQHKINTFNEQTKNRYNIRLIMITSEGLEQNQHANDIVNLSLTLSDIIKRMKDVRNG